MAAHATPPPSPTGRPSKGPRHTFAVKLDLERAERLKEIIQILDTNGIDYLSPLIAAHVDAIDLEDLRSSREGA